MSKHAVMYNITSALIGTVVCFLILCFPNIPLWPHCQLQSFCRKHSPLPWFPFNQIRSNLERGFVCSCDLLRPVVGHKWKGLHFWHLSSQLRVNVVLLKRALKTLVEAKLMETNRADCVRDRVAKSKRWWDAHSTLTPNVKRCSSHAHSVLRVHFIHANGVQCKFSIYEDKP